MFADVDKGGLFKCQFKVNLFYVSFSFWAGSRHILGLTTPTNSCVSLPNTTEVWPCSTSVVVGVDAGQATCLIGS
jgi:hypothetical protein